MGNFQALLDGLRKEFLAELPERCDSCDELILALEKTPGGREAFNELYRGVHSLKGSGGTHGLVIVTTLCHQLETLLSEAEAQRNFDATFATRALAYVDLLRRVETAAYADKPDYSSIEADLGALRKLTLKRRKAGLIVESSSVMTGLYQKALESMPLQLTLVDNGLAALARLLHEPYDFIIVGGELKNLNGTALMAALRNVRTRNQNIHAILVSSKRDAIPDYARFSATLPRDKGLANNLVDAVRSVLPEYASRTH